MHVFVIYSYIFIFLQNWMSYDIFATYVGVAFMGLAPVSWLIADISVGRYSHHNMEKK